jgi:hypothetical protein
VGLKVANFLTLPFFAEKTTEQVFPPALTKSSVLEDNFYGGILTQTDKHKLMLLKSLRKNLSTYDELFHEKLILL